MTTQTFTRNNTTMDLLFGKATIAFIWLLAAFSGQAMLYILGAIPSVLASIHWIIKIRKELKNEKDAGKDK